MVAIQGIGGVPEPKPERPARVRESRDPSVTSNQAKDDVLISSEAQAAAQLSKMVQTATQENEVRGEKVAAAREHLAKGEYQKPDIVAKVAEKLSKYLP